MSRILAELRAALAASEQSRYRIAQETGIAESVLSRFLSGERGIGIETIESLADCLELELTLGPKRKRPRKDR